MSGDPDIWATMSTTWLEERTRPEDIEQANRVLKQRRKEEQDQRNKDDKSGGKKK